MKTVLILGLLVAFVAVCLADEANGDQIVDVNNLSSDLKNDLGSNVDDFQKFSKRFNKKLKRKNLQKAAKAFKKNNEALKGLQEKNKNRKFKLKMNEFMALDPQEFQSKVLLGKGASKRRLFAGVIDRKEARRLRKEKREKKKAARQQARQARKEARLAKKAGRQQARAQAKAARKQGRHKRGLLANLREKKKQRLEAAAAAASATEPTAPEAGGEESATEPAAEEAEEVAQEPEETPAGDEVTEEVTEAVPTENNAVEEEKEPYDPQIDDKLPEKFDWRDYGVITPVKNQGGCGSCWAFSATAVLEAQHARKHPGELLDLAEQSSECATKKGTICEGGRPEDVFEYFKNASLGLETDNPYDPAGDMTCKRSITSKVQVDKHIDLSGSTIDEVKDALIQDGPITVGAYLPEEFNYYGGGLFDVGCTEKDGGYHLMMIVGFGKESDGTPYWLIRNSWGEDWGDQGYIKWKMGENLCSIETDFAQAKIKDL